MGGRVVNGVGADPDIVVASAKAYLAALNKLHSKPNGWRPRGEVTLPNRLFQPAGER